MARPPEHRDVFQLLGLVAFSFASAATPGPNNVLLWASGASFGARRTLPHVLGTAAGIGAMALGSAAGIAALVAAVPALGVAMRVVGSAYLLFLAWQIARSGSLASTPSTARPMTLPEAAGFQLVNPKAWIFALGAVTTFRPTDLPPIPATLVVAAVMIVVILPSAGLWVVFGDAIGRLLSTERSLRVVNVVLAALVVATIALVWV
ncbi:MAG TPA: LysE family translocator [Candidatus Limnocylindrales bacterium]|nr:LysE family translocator [Candidatus Limnocylindrales bacterium]